MSASHIEIAETNENIDISSSPKVAVCCARLRWSFIRKVYGILCLQLFLAVAVSASFTLFGPLNYIFLHTTGGLVLYVVTALIPFALLWPMYLCRKRPSINSLLLTLSSVTFALAVGVTCAMDKAGLVLQGVTLMTAVVVTLCSYTFLAAKKSHENCFWKPFLSCLPLALLLSAVFQKVDGLWVHPVDKKLLAITVACLFCAILFSAALIFNTNKMIRRCSE